VEDTRDQKWLFYGQHLIGMMVLLMLALSVTIHKASGVAAFIMLIISMLGLAVTDKTAKLESWERWWIGSTLFFFGLILLDVLRGYGDISVLDSPSRLILAIPVFLYVRRVGINLNYLLVGAAIGAVLAGGYAWYQHMQLGMGMAMGITSHIYFGQIALILTLFALFALIESKDNRLKIAYGVTVIIGGYAVLASGSRGGWIALPTILVLLMGYNVWQISLRRRIYAVMIVVLVALAAYQTPSLPVGNRVDAAVDNFMAYFEEGRVQTSTGYRLEMWKAAWMMAEDTHFMGVGEDGYNDAVKKLIDEGRVHQTLDYFNAPHSQYFNALSEQGVIGLISLLMMMLVPLKVLMERAKQPDDQCVLSILGAVTIIGYLDFMLTQETLERQLMVLIYAFVMSIILAQFSYQSRMQPTKSAA